MLLLFAIAFGQDCLTPGDCDGDDWTIAQGDCDDDDPDVHPGVREACDNTLDDDCDNLINEGCGRDDQRGALAGGGCGSADAGLALLLLPLVRRRR